MKHQYQSLFNILMLTYQVIFLNTFPPELATIYRVSAAPTTECINTDCDSKMFVDIKPKIPNLTYTHSTFLKY